MLFSPLSIGIDSLLLSLFPTKSPCPFFKSCIDEQKDRRREILAAVLPCIVTYTTQKRQPLRLSLLCWRYLFFRPVSRQVSSAQVSLTSVFGMGTGGPSLQSTPTHFFLKEKVSKKNFTPFFFQEEGLRFNYHTLKTEQSNRRTRASACIPFLALNLRLQVKPSAY